MIVGYTVDADMAVFASFVEAKDEQPGEPERDGGVLRHRHFPVLLIDDTDCVRNAQKVAWPPFTLNAAQLYGLRTSGEPLLIISSCACRNACVVDSPSLLRCLWKAIISSLVV